MGLAGDDRVADQQTHRQPAPARRFGGGEGEVIPLRRGRRSVAERLERDRVIRERLEQRRRTRLERLRHERAQRVRRERYVWSRRKQAETAPRERTKRPSPARPEPQRARIRPGVQGPVRKRARAAENRRRASTRRRGLFWPTAKAASL